MYHKVFYSIIHIQYFIKRKAWAFLVSIFPLSVKHGITTIGGQIVSKRLSWFLCFKQERFAEVVSPTQSNAPHRTSGILCVFSTCFTQSKSIKKGSLFSQPLAHSPPFFIHLHPIQKTNAKNTQKPLPSYYYIINLIIHSQHPTQSP